MLIKNLKNKIKTSYIKIWNKFRKLSPLKRCGIYLLVGVPIIILLVSLIGFVMGYLMGYLMRYFNKK